MSLDPTLLPCTFRFSDLSLTLIPHYAEGSRFDIMVSCCGNLVSSCPASFKAKKGLFRFNQDITHPNMSLGSLPAPVPVHVPMNATAFHKSHVPTQENSPNTVVILQEQTLKLGPFFYICLNLRRVNGSWTPTPPFAPPSFAVFAPPEAVACNTLRAAVNLVHVTSRQGGLHQNLFGLILTQHEEACPPSNIPW